MNGYGYTFNGCKNLETVSIASPNLSTCMFTSCDNLKSVVLEETVETVPYGAFQYCSQLSDITFYNPETEIYDGTLVSVRPTVHGYEGSTAYDWAMDKGFAFQALNASVQTRVLTAQILTPAGEPVTEASPSTGTRRMEPPPAGTGDTLLRRSAGERITLRGGSGRIPAGAI